MFELNKYIDYLSKENYKEALNYKNRNMPEKIYKYIWLDDIECDNKNSKCDKSINLNNIKIQSIKDDKIWLSTYDNLNDPFELSALYLKEKEIINHGWPIDIVKAVFEKIKKEFLIGSFTTHLSDSLPMWAHYANNHKGVCLEYTVVNPSYLYKVSYEMQRIPIASIITNLISDVMHKKQPDHKYLMSIFNGGCIKDKSWINEDEFRILYANINKKDNGDLIKLNDIGLKLNSVYFGINCINNYEEEIKNICDEKECKCYKMYIKNDAKEFKLDYKKY
jgi:Protein of unknown function (DUF2971).